jgi:hypothetical protein
VTTEQPNNTLTQIFECLDTWRDLPAYRLESRVAPFFAVYMREAVSRHTGADLHDLIIPEFPLRLGTIGRTKNHGKNQSVKVDYALFSRQLDTMYLVELKTDQTSRRSGQDDYLKRAKGDNGYEVIEGVLELANASKYRHKYRYLLTYMARIGLISVPENVLYESGASLTRLLRKSEITLPNSMKVKVIYVQPQTGNAGDGQDDISAIGFSTFADLLPTDTDPVAALFGEYLGRWQQAAGSDRPVSS